LPSQLLEKIYTPFSAISSPTSWFNLHIRLKKVIIFLLKNRKKISRLKIIAPLSFFIYLRVPSTWRLMRLIKSSVNIVILLRHLQHMKVYLRVSILFFLLQFFANSRITKDSPAVRLWSFSNEIFVGHLEEDLFIVTDQ
jgi:hypothetical protein